MALLIGRQIAAIIGDVIAALPGFAVERGRHDAIERGQHGAGARRLLALHPLGIDGGEDQGKGAQQRQHQHGKQRECQPRRFAAP
jgi:hypothetical protein